MKRLKVLLPISLDRQRSPISTLLREVAVRSPEFDFYSFRSPETDEDEILSRSVWSLPNMHEIQPIDILKHRFDITHHASHTNKNLAASFLARMRSMGHTRHVFTINSQDRAEDGWRRQFLVALRAASTIVSVSHAVRLEVEREYGRKVDYVIPNGADLDFFSPEKASISILQDLGIQRPFFLFCAATEPRKRADVFLKLASRMPEYSFIMIGRNASEEYTRQLLSGKPDNVSWLGQQQRSVVRDLMAASAALIFPSEREGLPLSVAEAAAAGTPVLAQPASSLPEIVKDGVTGWLQSVDDTEAWLARMQQILAWTPQERQNFVDGSRRFITENFSWASIARAHQEMYRKICG